MPFHITYLYVACRGHSGSTLLAKMLGCFPQILNVGEIKHFDRYFDQAKKCGSGELLPDCSLWKGVVEKLQPNYVGSMQNTFPTDGVRKGKITNFIYHLSLLFWPGLVKWWAKWPGSIAAENKRSIENHWSLIQTATRLSNRSIILDKSMSCSRFMELAIFKPPNVKLHLIHLVRDGRANMFSYMRRYNDTPEQAIRGWAGVNQNIERCKHFFWKGNTTLIKYEELSSAPEATCQKLMRKAGLNSLGSIDIERSYDHSIGGNEDRFTGYKTIRLDQKWEQGLNRKSMKKFAQIGSTLNRKYGYE